MRASTSSIISSIIIVVAVVVVMLIALMAMVGLERYEMATDTDPGRGGEGGRER